MAGWLSALKFVPWGQVIDAAPQIVQGARKLMRRGDENTPQPPAAPAAVHLGGEPRDVLGEQLAALQQRVNQLQEEQRASAVLIRSLAEQNAQVVRAVEALRVRSRWLALACALLGVASTGLLAWVLSH
ncbi:hypothetical protein SAMN05428957_107140 [Oryzisolibacter propanilivorax]|uniref:Uncharacterized protein n=1 Tax=Oryzisolibacter propanilivorax TaxID=1527607 RepID=A0A1G9U2J4_9BURK|nr:hypothetical protein [Oryzisolibacter propanilivorax]SDM54116.1 hypothetical protein SAMN05428957_107140 [Oryzisolibacter propanilivorax]